MAKKHSPIGKQNKFIPEPDDKYRDNCGDPGWQGRKKGGKKDSYEFDFILKRKVRDEAGNVVEYEYYPMGFNAHHILSVSCVNDLEGLNSGQRDAVLRCCRETDWNINNKNNMIALPLFGHTLKWYFIDENEDEPDWKDLPQHDWDHNSKKGYCNDVSGDIQNFYKGLEQELDEHNVKAKSIASNLISMEGNWRGKIKSRGSGTDAAWKNKDSGWYKPFSMASDSNANYRSPLRIENKKNKLEKLIEEWSALP